VSVNVKFPLGRVMVTWTKADPCCFGRTGKL